ncbi:hypothetical protein CPU12_13400 [Malaciobacter molluscorum LMG 25693]|uniref:Membrane protein n=1 Tax=Malaciobacter molluscorum LMG 25693 TaxID=870501 RepID=A0A2G1DEL9_9BACT|nr:hypothetical protein [Malaciobacter molluscorum]AXX91147.1 putative membrane protein [Malaciobacter molluscorum LMG 25693]PHO16880.1 hypothetical protein CPU12_13400 [Malaciobacter molluscorum LMG 25693]
MNGIVLNITETSGIIVDDNGERYTFEINEVKQGSLKNGSKVNFVNNDGLAKDIYLLNSANIASDTTETISKGILKGASVASSTGTLIKEKIDSYTNGSQIQKMGLIAAFGAVIVILFFNVSDILTIVGFAIEMFALYNLGIIKKNMSFFTYRIKAIISFAIAMFILNSIVMNFFIIFQGENLIFNGFKAVLLIVAIIYSIYSIFKAYTQLGKIFNNKLFIISAWLYIAALISPILFILMKDLPLALDAPYYLVFGHYIILIIAYIKIKDDKVEENDVNND